MREPIVEAALDLAHALHLFPEFFVDPSPRRIHPDSLKEAAEALGRFRALLEEGGRAPALTPPAQEGFEVWHARECPHGGCQGLPHDCFGSEVGDRRKRFDARTCREVYAAENPAPEPRGGAGDEDYGMAPGACGTFKDFPEDDCFCRAKNGGKRDAAFRFHGAGACYRTAEEWKAARVGRNPLPSAAGRLAEGSEEWSAILLCMKDRAAAYNEKRYEAAYKLEDTILSHLSAIIEREALRAERGGNSLRGEEGR